VLSLNWGGLYPPPLGGGEKYHCNSSCLVLEFIIHLSPYYLYSRYSLQKHVETAMRPDINRIFFLCFYAFLSDKDLNPDYKSNETCVFDRFCLCILKN